ncbi:MAG: hypothetical protein PHQ96_08310, partial [Candidatus Omnitrophica bacterium]|nr:hypothetical protein [Candidatus Omnitrophota bacterium]
MGDWLPDWLQATSRRLQALKAKSLEPEACSLKQIINNKEKMPKKIDFEKLKKEIRTLVSTLG